MISDTPSEISIFPQGRHFTASITDLEHPLYLILTALSDGEALRTSTLFLSDAIQGYVADELRAVEQPDLARQCETISFAINKIAPVYQLIAACGLISNCFIDVHQTTPVTKNPVI